MGGEKKKKAFYEMKLSQLQGCGCTQSLLYRAKASRERQVSGINACAVPSYSVVSTSLRPHGQQPARLLCPCNFPGKNTGVGCHFLLQGIFPTQESNSCLLLGRQILYQLSYKGSPYLPVEGKNMVYHYCFSFLFFGHFHQPSLPGLAVMRLDPGVLIQLSSENGAGAKTDGF